MAQKLIVTISHDVDFAQRAARDLRNFAGQGDGFRIESGVVIQKDTTGKLAMLDPRTRPFLGTGIGAVTGGLNGLPGGPVGAIAGFTMGVSAELAGHAPEDILDSRLAKSISGELLHGNVALILEGGRPSSLGVDNVVPGYGGKVFPQLLFWRHARLIDDRSLHPASPGTGALCASRDGWKLGLPPGSS